MGSGAVTLEAEFGGSWAVGTPDQAAARIREYEGVAVDRIIFHDMLPHDLEYVDLLGALAKEWAA